MKSGDGGDGAITFRREKFIPYGGPDGGNGGRGGDVIVRAVEEESSLMRFKRNQLYQADNGFDGGGRGRHGRNGKDLVLVVPAGTVLTRKSGDVEEFITDLEIADSEMVVARGGKGGWGNKHYTSPINQAPRIAQKGEPGDELDITLEMRMIADVGIIGYPNVGKSTLLAVATAAKPKIASYPFTTIEPVLGVVETAEGRFVIAEIPGLIAGAHLGKGLGHDFLRHALRTKILIHLIDGTSKSPVEDMFRVNEELNLFDMELARKPQMVALNKIDMPEVQVRLSFIKEAFNSVGIRAYYISATTGKGVPELITETANVLRRVAVGRGNNAMVPMAVLRPWPKYGGISVMKQGNVFILKAPELERIKAGTGVSASELRWQLQGQFKRLGVNKALEKAGVKPGDRVRCGALEWEW